MSHIATNSNRTTNKWKSINKKSLYFFRFVISTSISLFLGFLIINLIDFIIPGKEYWINNNIAPAIISASTLLTSDLISNMLCKIKKGA